MPKKIMLDTEPVDEMPEESPVEETPKKAPAELRYAVKANGAWTDDVVEGDESGFAGKLGYPITDIVIDGVAGYRVRTSAGWSRVADSYDKSDSIGNGLPIIAIDIQDDVSVGVHVCGGVWLPTVTREAGCLVAMDAIWIKKNR